MSLTSKIKKLPEASGVYFFLDTRGKILYIGKATSICDRVKSYFSKDIYLTRGPLIEKMISEVKDINFEETDSVLEALILEANLIRKHKPKYNSLGKDDKSWNYVVITAEDFPRIFTMRERDIVSGKAKDKIKYSFGPYPHGNQLKQALQIIRKIFPFRDQKSKNSHNERFYQQIELAPETSSKEAKKEYQKTIRNIKLFFDGKKSKLIKLLEKEMKEEAKAKNFEKAGELKRKIFALNHIQDISLLKREELSGNNKKSMRIEAYDISHISGDFVVGAMTVVEDGQPKKSDYRKFKIKREPGIDDTKALKEILERRFSHPEWPKPEILVVDGGVAQRNTALDVFDSLQIFDIEVVAVTKNIKHKPEKLLAESRIAEKYSKEILLANNESHRFVLSYHRQLRGKLKD